MPKGGSWVSVHRVDPIEKLSVADKLSLLCAIRALTNIFEHLLFITSDLIRKSTPEGLDKACCLHMYLDSVNGYVLGKALLNS